MKIKEIVKVAASVATGLGVGKTVDLILKENLPVNMTWKTRLATFIGSAAISGYISSKCSKYVEDEIDQVADMMDKIKEANDVKAIQEHVEVSKELDEETN